MTDLLDRHLASLASVSLAELDEAASLQTRRDRKYLVSIASAGENRYASSFVLSQGRRTAWALGPR